MRAGPPPLRPASPPPFEPPRLAPNAGRAHATLPVPPVRPSAVGLGRKGRAAEAPHLLPLPRLEYEGSRAWGGGLGGGGGGDGDGEAADAHVGSGGVVRRATAASRARYAAASQYCSEHFFQIERAAVHSYGLDSDSC